jgi:hypothetical protein
MFRPGPSGLSWLTILSRPSPLTTGSKYHVIPGQVQFCPATRIPALRRSSEQSNRAPMCAAFIAAPLVQSFPHCPIRGLARPRRLLRGAKLGCASVQRSILACVAQNARGRGPRTDDADATEETLQAVTSEVVSRSHIRWRVRVFLSMLVGYSVRQLFIFADTGILLAGAIQYLLSD